MPSVQEALFIVDYLKTVDTPTLSNAIELLKVRPPSAGFTPLAIRALFPEFGRMCGYAVTAQVETITESEPFDMGRFIELFRAVDAAPKPSVVVLQEIGGHSDSAAHCGEVMATFLMRLGAIGLVSDCAVRDLAEVHALGFHYFARGSVASHANFRIVRSGVPVHVLGMVAHTGDLLHGDVNGVLSIPKIDVERLAEKVDLIRARERRLMEFVRGSDFSLDRVLEVAE